MGARAATHLPRPMANRAMAVVSAMAAISRTRRRTCVHMDAQPQPVQAGCWVLGLEGTHSMRKHQAHAHVSRAKAASAHTHHTPAPSHPAPN